MNNIAKQYESAIHEAGLPVMDAQDEPKYEVFREHLFLNSSKERLETKIRDMSRALDMRVDTVKFISDGYHDMVEDGRNYLTRTLFKNYKNQEDEEKKSILHTTAGKIFNSIHEFMAEIFKADMRKNEKSLEYLHSYGMAYALSKRNFDPEKKPEEQASLLTWLIALECHDLAELYIKKNPDQKRVVIYKTLYEKVTSEVPDLGVKDKRTLLLGLSAATAMTQESGKVWGRYIADMYDFSTDSEFEPLVAEVFKSQDKFESEVSKITQITEKMDKLHNIIDVDPLGKESKIDIIHRLRQTFKFLYYENLYRLYGREMLQSESPDLETAEFIGASGLYFARQENWNIIKHLHKTGQVSESLFQEELQNLAEFEKQYLDRIFEFRRMPSGIEIERDGGKSFPKTFMMLMRFVNDKKRTDLESLLNNPKNQLIVSLGMLRLAELYSLDPEKCLAMPSR